jgi:hypothetical protein
MPVTSTQRILVAQQFVRFGFGEHIEAGAPFYSADFLTQELTTTEVQAVLGVVERFNTFAGGTVAGAIERFRGRVRSWRFGRAGSPMLVVTLPYWTHQVEEEPLGAPTGTLISDHDHLALVEALREVFVKELDVLKFEAYPGVANSFAAWWR